MKLIAINNGDSMVPILEGATYIYNSQLSNEKQNRNRLFQLIKYNENAKSDISWMDTNRSSKIEMSKALLYDYLPTVDENIKISMIPIDTKCWKCKKDTTIIAGVLLECQDGKYSEFFDFPFLLNVFLETSNFIMCSKKYNIGQIKRRYSKTVQASYISNGCSSCDAIYGSYYLKEELLEYQVHDELPEPICEMTLCYNELEKYLDKHLFFKKFDKVDKGNPDVAEDSESTYEEDFKSNYSSKAKNLTIIEELNKIQDEITLQLLLDKRSLNPRQLDIIGRMKYFYINSTRDIDQKNLVDEFSIVYKENNFQLISYKSFLIAIVNIDPWFVAYHYYDDKFIKIITNRFQENIKPAIIDYINESDNMF